jgi:hypothetical protein
LGLRSVFNDYCLIESELFCLELFDSLSKRAYGFAARLRRQMNLAAPPRASPIGAPPARLVSTFVLSIELEFSSKFSFECIDYFIV